MRRTHRFLATSILYLAGFGLAGFGASACQIDSLGDDEIGSTELATTGGPANGQSHYDAVAAITILLPLDPDLDPEVTPRDEFRYCTGVLIEDRTVMTAAGCLFRNLEAELDDDVVDDDNPFLSPGSVFVQFGFSITGTTEYALDDTFDTGPSTTKGLTMHRYYDSDFKGRNDVALLRLKTSPGITPVPVALSFDDSFEGSVLELVGYGKFGPKAGNDDFTDRNVVKPIIAEITDTRVKAGDTDDLSCYADSGGPGFLVIDSVSTVATVGVTHNINECDPDENRQRVDLHTADFISPFIEFHSDNCGGAGCADCSYNGVCEEDCPTRDWDCELGSFTGQGCGKDGDCEERGKCIPATDDPSFSYCAKPCDAEQANSCPTEMTCSAGECIWADISPGSQGAECGSPGDCRSGYCETGFCAYECDASDADACDPANDVYCLAASTDSSTTVCRLEVRTGGGGFCEVSATSIGHTGARNTFLAGFGLLLLLGIVRRRL